jgi:hypothetical protein
MLVNEKKDRFLLFMFLGTTRKREEPLITTGKENNGKSDETWRKLRDSFTVEGSLYASL